MRFGTTVGLFLILTMLGSVQTGAAEPAELLGVDAARARAMIAADGESLQRLLHDDVTYGHSNGRTDSKSSIIDKLVAGRVSYEVIDSTDPSVRLFGSTGIVTGPVTLRVRAGERLFEGTSIFTAVYVRSEGHWRLVAYHSSPVRS